MYLAKGLIYWVKKKKKYHEHCRRVQRTDDFQKPMKPGLQNNYEGHGKIYGVVKLNNNIDFDVYN